MLSFSRNSRWIAISFSFALVVIPSGPVQAAVGYLNRLFASGDNLACNPLLLSPEDRPTNNLNDVFKPVDGTTLSFWNPASRSFDRTITYTEGIGWSEDVAWEVGQGALVHAPTNFVATFVGTMLAPDGSFPTGDQINGLAPLPRPPAFSGPTGLYLLASKYPGWLKSPEMPVFEWVVGRGPQEGEQFTWLVASNQTYHTTTFSSNRWDNGEPELSGSEAAFFNLIGVPPLQVTAVGNQFVVSWPAWATNFVVETSTNFGPGAAWSSLTNASPVGPNTLAVTNEATLATAFYRLRKW